MKKRSGGQILIESLQAHGVKKVFCVPGESYLDVLDALVDSGIRTVTCRHEAGAAFMAEAYAKISGKVGICFVTRGPGACNASIGVHTAMQDSTPLVLFVGQVARHEMGREAFQEIDYREMFKAPVTKWATQIENASDLPQVLEKVFATALEGRPGPVVVALPEDMLCEESDVQVSGHPEAPAHFSPQHTEFETLKDILRAAERPLAIVGGGSWTDAAIHDFEDFCARAEIPCAVSFRRQDAFSNNHPCYAGALGFTFDPKLAAHVKNADVILAVGTRLNDIATQGYTSITAPQPQQRLIHVYPDAGELGRVYKAEMEIHAHVVEFTKTLKDAEIDGAHRADWRALLRRDYEAFSTLPASGQFAVDVNGIFAEMIAQLPEDAVITTDAGNFSGWAQRYLRYARPMRLLAPTSGAMGYGAPAAVAASIAFPGRAVVCLVGDGGFMMTGQEMATAMREGASPVFLVFNNNMYGTIRMYQEKIYPGRVSGTDLVNPDFAALAKSYGAFGAVVEKTEDFAAVFKAALSCGKPALIEVRMDPEQISTGKKLSEL